MNRHELEALVTKSFHHLLAEKHIVIPIDVFIDIGKLSKADMEDWRFRRIPYLERVIGLNLAQVAFVLKILQRLAVHAQLKPSFTAYRSWGKGKKFVLRFSKFGHHYAEQIWATHYVNTVILSKLRREKEIPNTNHAISTEEHHE